MAGGGAVPLDRADEGLLAGRIGVERAVAWLLVLVAYSLATVVMTWPYAAHLAIGVPPGEDPLLQVWISRWVQHALVTQPLHLYDTNAFYPLKDTLAYSDSNIPAGLLAAPIYLLTHNAILANNLLVLGTFVLAAAGAYALIGYLSGNRAAGFLAGLAYAFLPYRFAHLWHLNQLGHAWTPWVLLALVLLIARPAWWRAVVLGVLLATQILTSFYVAFQIAIAVALVVAIALVVSPQARGGRCLAALTLAAGLALVIVVPLALPYLAVRDQQGLERTLEEAERYEAVPTSFLKVQQGNRIWSRLNEKHGGEDTLFPGALAFLGAIIGLVGYRRRPAVTAAALVLIVVGVVLALGPTWHPGAEPGPPLPYRLFFRYFPFFTAMRVPARFAILALFALIVLAGLGVAWAWERLAARLAPETRRVVGAAVTAVLALGILGELYSAPMPIVDVDRSPEVMAPYRWLAEQPDRDPVMEFPSQSDGRAAATAMYWSTLHWKPIVGGYSGFAPRAHDELVNAFTSDLRRPDGTVAEQVSYVSPQNIGVLQALGVRYLVIHRYGYKREDWAPMIAQLEATGDAVEPAGEFGEAVIYRVRPADAPLSPVTVALHAPALAVAGTFWEPAVVARNPTQQQAFFFIERPITLQTTWRDAGGRVVRRDTLPVKLPAVLPPGEFFCSVRACPTVPEAALPPTDANSLRLFPAKPGHYAVELALSGGVSVSQTFEVEVADSPKAGDADGPPLALVAAAIAAPTLAPGAALDVNLTWETRHQPAEDYTFFAQLIGPDGKVRGQYDAPAGWTGHYTSAWLAGERIALHWAVPLQPDAPPGAYRLLVGMYRHVPSGVERISLRYPDGDNPEFWAAELTVP